VAFLLNARTVEPEKKPLLVNCFERTFLSRQLLIKHVPKATDKHATIKVLLETVFSILCVQRGYKEGKWGNRVSSVWEAVKKRDC
jgi:hypothetical protein